MKTSRGTSLLAEGGKNLSVNVPPGTWITLSFRLLTLRTGLAGIMKPPAVGSVVSEKGRSCSSTSVFETSEVGHGDDRVLQPVGVEQLHRLSSISDVSP